MILAYPDPRGGPSASSRSSASIAIPGRWLGQADGRYTAGPIVWVVRPGWPSSAGLQGRSERRSTASSPAIAGRADYLSRPRPAGREGGRPDGLVALLRRAAGYTFANLVEAMGDRSVSRVVVRDAHLRGPWEYCRPAPGLIGDRKPVASFPEHPGRQAVRSFVYDWSRRAPPSGAIGGTR